MTIGVRQARKAAYRIAAAMLRDNDLDGLFGDLYHDHADDEASVQNLTDAIEHCANRIERLARD